MPNAELAASTGPFGLVFAKMFNPLVGQIVMALAVMACIGSLLGWQFTLASTAKDAADANMFPQTFAKVTAAGARRLHGAGLNFSAGIAQHGGVRAPVQRQRGLPQHMGRLQQQPAPGQIRPRPRHL